MINRENTLKNLLPAIIMGLLSLIPIGLYILAIPYLFIEKFLRKQTFSEIGFKIKGIKKDILKYWWLIILPIATGYISLFLSKLIVPDFFNHVIERTQPMLVFDKLAILIPQLLILALAEEICFRAFLQRKLAICMDYKWAIAITSLIFALGHFSTGSPMVVLYDLTWIFIDSVIYGFIFQKTKNVYLCWISHFLANVCGILVLLAV